MSYNLFLDDLRLPEHAYIYPKRDVEGIIIHARSLTNISGIDCLDWVIVRTYKDFVSTIEERGLPNVVSFDHDLTVEYIQHYYKVTEKTGVIEYGNLTPDSGYHCAKYFVQKCKELKPKKLPEVYVHSANKYGVEEILKVLDEIY